jgi:Uma2 family endonuclease
MPAETAPDLMTAEQLLVLDLPGKSTELVRGRLIVREPPSAHHGKIAARLLFLLGQQVYPQHLGDLFAQDTGFQIEWNPDTIRAPDVAFVDKSRTSLIDTRSFGPLAPDLVAEILSPDDRPGEVLKKIGDWLDAGVRLVWVIDPRRQEALVYRPDGSVTRIDVSGALEGEDVLPGFSCPLADVLK